MDITKLAVTLQVLAVRARARLADERGQGTLEYVGMIAVAAVLIIAVLQMTETIDLAGFFRDQVDRVKDEAG